MVSIIEKDYIICGSCNLKFERDKEFRNCCNCFACTGCEIYYCPGCNNEIVITPVKSIRNSSDHIEITRKRSKKRNQKKS
jgi:hypothetical protein